MENSSKLSGSKDAALKERMKSVVMGMLIGHQMGQWSERKFWNFNPGNEADSCESAISSEELLNTKKMHPLILNPPTITTPGWAPTCFIDTVPHIFALGMEYIKLGRSLTPEDFRNFLLRERTWLRPQAVGRTCIELMAEGMNPRIAGLFAPSVLAGCWIAWPAAIYNAGYFNDAYEDAVKLARAQNSEDIAVLTGLLSAMIAEALKPGSVWSEVRNALLKMASKRSKTFEKFIIEALEAGRNYNTAEAWIDEVSSRNFKSKFSKYAYNIDWMADFFIAVSALEYANLHGANWLDFMRQVLMSCDTRFGVMIAASVRTALGGYSSMPDVWKENAEKIHNTEIVNWVEGAYALVKAKFTKECKISKEILSQIKNDIEDSQLYDKILAGFLCGAAGNVMGSPVEDRDYPWIAEKYGVLDKILDPTRLESEDDAAMAVMWAEAYIRCGGRIYPEDLASIFREKMIRNNFYYDSQQAYDLMINGLPPHACGHWNIVTGSGLMGCNPCGMYHAGDPESAAVDGLELAYHYQRGFDVHAPAILCAATAEALREGSTVDSVLEAAVNAAPEEPQAYFNRIEKRDARSHIRRVLAAVDGCPDVLSARKILYDGFLEYNGQDPWEVIAFTLAIFKVAKGDIWQSMIGGTNIGRDSDTISSQAAILSACMRGMKGSPQQILSLFNENSTGMYKRLAKELTSLVKEKCLRSLDTAQKLGVTE